MAPVIGIDLGTTNTVVAVVRDGQASAIADETGQTLIPSVVSFHPSGTVLVGQSAKIRRLVDATNTIYSVKRLIGRSWQTDEVREARARFPFEMREGPGQAALVVGRGETYTLPEISAFVLRKAKSVAESFLREPVERAVITVPANFNDLQRAATKVAGRVAGLEVLRILNEPTAAALAYGFGKDTSERLAVYDFGGGTFDVTLLDLSDNVFEVLATAGNTFLGGDDIDLAIAERMADEFLGRHRADPRADPQAFERIRAAAEHIKLRLSYENEASVSMDEIAHGPQGRALGLEFQMDRAALERLASPIIDRTFDVCREALELARSSAEDFDQVLLVGGSTRVPLVRQRVEEFFGRELRANLSPDEVVALGAAIQANALTGMERRRAAIPVPPAVGHRTNTEPRVPAAPARPRMATLQGVPLPAEAALESVRKEESVAFTLSDNDLEDMADGSLGEELVHAPEPYWLDSPALDYPEDEITAAGRGTHDTTEDEPTRVGIRVPPALPPLPEPARAGAAFSAPAFSGFGALREIPEVPSAPPASVGPGPSVPPGRSLPPLTSTRSSRPPVSPIPAPAPFQGAPLTSDLPPPLLVDVTPFTLSVETVSGFCDGIISRNTPVPCEETREFVTASDGQTSVRVRVAQGESRRFDENTLLGEVELSGLLSAPRGAVQIAVTFGLDANGMLNVSALDKQTGRATTVQLRLLGMPDSIQLSAMIERHATRLPH